jgi:uncharacterized membrane-anchored protein
MNKRTLFIFGVALQLLAIFGLFTHNFSLVSGTDVVRLKTLPVDPWSMTRGEYVTLNYAIGSDFPVPDDPNQEYDQPVFVVVEIDEDGFANRTRFTTSVPTLAEGEYCVRGRLQWNSVWFPDIAQYFVEEGTGLELEQAAGHRLYVDVAVNDRCRARIKEVTLGEEVPDAMNSWMGIPEERIPDDSATEL